jgi:hypothetical protein
VKIALTLAMLLTSATWADEAADRTAVEAVVSALNNPRPELFTADFPNAAELRRFQTKAPVFGEISACPGTLVISREPMGEATWYPSFTSAAPPRFITRSVTFVSPDTAIVVATHEQESVLLVLKNENSTWRIASFRSLPEARVLLEAEKKPIL